MEALRKLNFQNLIHVDVPDVEQYKFDDYRTNGYEHTPIIGYCTSCEEKKCSFTEDDTPYRLTNISHGAHSSDFFRALKEPPRTERWHQEPILFVYETPIQRVVGEGFGMSITGPSISGFWRRRFTKMESLMPTKAVGWPKPFSKNSKMAKSIRSKIFDFCPRKRRLVSMLCVIILTLLFNLSCFTTCFADCCTGEIAPKSGATSSNTYVWEGKKLKPKSGATSEDTWLFDGKELRKASGAKSSNTYVWTGFKLYPKSGATSSRTWIWNGKELKPQSGAKSSNTWFFDHCQWKLKQGAISGNSWVITGFVPIPVSALVILGLN